jgi:hypothetical protein
MLHGLPILFQGTCNTALSKSILDLHLWAGKVFKGRDISMAREHFIKLTFGNKIEEYIVCDGTGSPSAPEATSQTDSPKASVVHAARMVLPNMTSGSDIFESPRYINIPSVIEPVNETDERNILEHLIENLNSLFNCDLAPMCNVARDNVPIEDDPGIVLAGKRFVLCGASHMSRLANVFEDYGALLVDLSVPGWRASATNVEEMAGQLSSVLSEEFSGETFVVYQLFDNSVYMACSDGQRAAPCKGRDNKYHVAGRLELSTREEFRELFTTCLPLLRAGLMHTKILLTPLNRYLLKACCDDPTHVSNRTEPGYGTAMAEGLGRIGEWLRGLAFTRRIRNFAVVCPNGLLGREDRDFCLHDPVHLTDTGYSVLGKRLLESMISAELSRKAGNVPEQNTKHVKDRAEQRPAWVHGHDSSVRRLYAEERG